MSGSGHFQQEAGEPSSRRWATFTTNKTTFNVLFIYLVSLILLRFLPEGYKFQLLRRMACLSFLAILIPAVISRLLALG